MGVQVIPRRIDPIVLQQFRIELDFVYSTTRPGTPMHDTHADLLGSGAPDFTATINPDVDVVFLCVGHGKSVGFLEKNQFSKNTVIIDLSNDFRLKKDTQFQDYDFVYGLPENQREKIEKANAIANPGCFATAIQLALLPLTKPESSKKQSMLTPPQAAQARGWD